MPSINGLDDTSHFDEVEQVKTQPDIEAIKPQRNFSGRDLPFIGFTFLKEQGQSVTMEMVKRNSFASPAVNLNNSHVLNTAAYWDSPHGESPFGSRTRSPVRAEKGWDNTESKAVSLLEDIGSMNKEIKFIGELNLMLVILKARILFVLFLQTW